MKTIIFLLITFFSAAVFAGPESVDAVPKPVFWWEIAAGIIAIPAGILGLYYTFHLAQKVRLETRKLERELAEKEPTQLSTTNLAPPITPKTQDYVIRFIILEVAVRGWSLIVGIFSPFIVVASQALRDLDIYKDSHLLGKLAQTTAVTYATGAGYWVLFLLIGVPLLKDISKDLGMSLGGLMRRNNNG